MTDTSGWSLRSKVIGQEDHGLNFGATGSNADTSLSACFRSLLGMWVAYIMFTSALVGGTSSVLRCSAAGALPRHRYVAPYLCFRRLNAGLLEHPTFPVGVVGWLVGGAVYLARAIEYMVQTGRARSASFEWLFPLTGFRAFESGIDCRILGIVAIDAALMFVAT